MQPSTTMAAMPAACGLAAAYPIQPPRLRWRGDLAPDLRRGRSARQHHAARTAALIGTHPKRSDRFPEALFLITDFFKNTGEPPNPMTSCGAPDVARAAEGGGQGALVRPSPSHSFRKCRPKNPSWGVRRDSRERGRQVLGCKPGITYPGDTTPIAWEALAAASALRTHSP
jgi:hypothetical protein